MGAASTSGRDQPVENPEARGLLTTTIGGGILTAVLAAITIVLVALAFLDRHFSMSTGLRDLWDLLARVADTPLFVALYLVVPPLWAALAARWWLTQPSPRRPAWMVMIPLFAAGVFGAWAWLSTTTRHIDWVFGIEPLPRSVVDLGLADVDRWGALVVAGLLALIGCVGAGSAVMLNASRRSTTAGHSPPDAGH
jgi:hypothetical protein